MTTCPAPPPRSGRNQQGAEVYAWADVSACVWGVFLEGLFLLQRHFNHIRERRQSFAAGEHTKQESSFPALIQCLLGYYGSI